MTVNLIQNEGSKSDFLQFDLLVGVLLPHGHHYMIPSNHVLVQGGCGGGGGNKGIMH